MKNTRKKYYTQPYVEVILLQTKLMQEASWEAHDKVDESEQLSVDAEFAD
ncbi:MAG: hypothetical protein IKO28_04360 [Prevotella sp.]|nr:hypothetical protein [Prevotella sp.]